MIEHLVLFKFKPDVGDDHIARVAAALSALKGSVPSIVDLSTGRNFCDRAQGFQLGLVVRVKDKEGLGAYAAHPRHLAVVNELVKPYVENVLAVDYEF